jgi:acyl-CoA thioesterase I
MTRRSTSAAIALACALGAGAPLARVSDTCAMPESIVPLAGDLPAARTRLASGRGLTLVAIGSSSTQGHGASSAAMSYPAQLERALRERYPGQPIRVLNKGVGGQTAAQMLARFERDVIAEHPQLVLWQTGANDAMRGVEAREFAATLEAGLAQLERAGIEVVLLSPQYVRQVASAPNARAILERMTAIAATARVPLFKRYEIMERVAAVDPGAIDRMLDPDRLHLNDLGYRCLATQLDGSMAKLLGSAP